MRITRQKLIDLARRHAQETAAASPVISAYLTGSVASGDPLLGGSADVDIVLIHQGPPPRPREVLRLSDDVHLDISHHDRTQYANPRSVRVDPWLGPAVCEPVFLYDPDHFFEWSQAGARGQFHRPDHVAARARAMLEAARSIAPAAPSSASPDWLDAYLEAVLRGANAALLPTGFPAWGRSLGLGLAERTQTMGQPEIYEGFQRLLGSENGLAREVPAWVSAWARSMDAVASTEADPELHPSRRTYYLRGFQALVEAGHPEAVLWPLLATWNRAVRASPASAPPESDPAWAQALEALRLSDPHRASRGDDLESYLDHVEELIEAWAERSGA
jgi:hypothetical protein